MQFYMGKNTDIPSLINPMCTVPYYTWQVHADVPKSHVPPQSSQLVVSTTTPGQYELLWNTLVPSANE